MKRSTRSLESSQTFACSENSQFRVIADVGVMRLSYSFASSDHTSHVIVQCLKSSRTFVDWSYPFSPYEFMEGATQSILSMVKPCRGETVFLVDDSPGVSWVWRVMHGLRVADVCPFERR